MTDLELHEKIEGLAALQSKIKLLEASKEAYTEAIMGAIFEREPGADGKFRFATADYTALIRSKTDTKINKGKLIAAGVEIEKIEAATEKTVSKPWVQLYPKGAKEE